MWNAAVQSVCGYARGLYSKGWQTECPCMVRWIFQSNESYLRNSKKSLSTQEAHPPLPALPSPNSPPPHWFHSLSLGIKALWSVLVKNQCFWEEVTHSHLSFTLQCEEAGSCFWEQDLKEREWGYCGCLKGSQLIRGSKMSSGDRSWGTEEELCPLGKIPLWDLRSILSYLRRARSPACNPTNLELLLLWICGEDQS